MSSRAWRAAPSAVTSRRVLMSQQVRIWRIWRNMSRNASSSGSGRKTRRPLDRGRPASGVHSKRIRSKFVGQPRAGRRIPAARRTRRLPPGRTASPPVARFLEAGRDRGTWPAQRLLPGGDQPGRQVRPPGD